MIELTTLQSKKISGGIYFDLSIEVNQRDFIIGVVSSFVAGAAFGALEHDRAILTLLAMTTTMTALNYLLPYGETIVTHTTEYVVEPIPATEVPQAG